MKPFLPREAPPAPNRVCRFFIIASPCYRAPDHPSNHIFNGVDTGFGMQTNEVWQPATPFHSTAENPFHIAGSRRNCCRLSHIIF